MMLQGLMTPLRRFAGIRPIADLGTVHRGPLGQVDCEVSMWLEQWRGQALIVIQVIHRRGSSFVRTGVLKWPCSRARPLQLQAVIEDLRRVEAAVIDGSALVDRRGVLGRTVDGMIRRDYLGEYALGSVLPQRPRVRVSAALENSNAQTWVTLTERRRGRGMTMVQFPHAAVAALRQALERYAVDAD